MKSNYELTTTSSGHLLISDPAVQQSVMIDAADLPNFTQDVIHIAINHEREQKEAQNGSMEVTITVTKDHYDLLMLCLQITKTILRSKEKGLTIKWGRAGRDNDILA